MTLQNRINELFNKFNLSLSTIQKTELMAEATLENGTIIHTDAASFEEGALTYVLNEEGEKIPLPEGDYTLEDGSILSIAESGVVKSKSEGSGEAEAAPVADAQPPKSGKPPKKGKKSAQKKLAEDEADIEDWAGMEKRIKNLEDAIADIKERIGGNDDAEIVEEEMSAEEKAVQELKAMLEAQAEELTTLKSQAASEGVKRVTSTKVIPQVDLTSLSTEDRVKALFNKFNS